MKSLSTLLAALLLAVSSQLPAFSQTTAFTYQGFLSEQGGPAQGIHDLRFTIYDAASAGGAFGSPVDHGDVGVTNGLFTVTLDFGATPFDGSARWLDIAVRPGASAGAYTNLVPRQPITSAPYAIRAASATTVTMGAITDPTFIGTTTAAPLQLLVSNTVGLRLEYPTVGTVPNLVGGFSGNSVGAGTEGAVINGGGSFGNINSIGANSDNSSIGGGLNNFIASNSFNATIAGGLRNLIGVSTINCAIGGGRDNAIGTNCVVCTIAGGFDNSILRSTDGGAILGGFRNQIDGNIVGRQVAPVIVAGSDHSIGTASDFTVILGGDNNHIGTNASFSVILGGDANEVADNAQLALAAGRRAQANHAGAFVWADSQNTSFASTGTNQFLIRASGGVGINTAAPEADLHIFRGSAGTATPSVAALLALESDTSAFIHMLTPNNVASGILFGNPDNSLDASLRYNFFGNRELIFRTGDNNTRMVILTNGFVGIGNLNPTNRLMVVNARCDGSSWINASDRNLKQGFAPLDPLEVLAKVAALPIQSWSYKEQPEQKHVGPVAQDFRAAFGLGQDDTSIATVDADGVALAAIQGLNQKTEDRSRKSEARIQKLETENAELKRELAEIKNLLKTPAR